VALAGTSDNVDCHNEVFVQIGFECMVVPVNNDLNTDTGGGEAHAVPCWQFPLELRLERPDQLHSAVQRSGSKVNTVCSR